jgi:hypothetical protein
MSQPALVIPVRHYRPERGRFAWPRQVVLASPSTADLVPLEQLAADLRAVGVRAGIDRAAWGPAAVRVVRDKAVTAAEGYRLCVTPRGIEIAASSDAGAYYAVQTLRKLVRAHGRTLPACRIDDAPDFRRRGVYLDCARGKVPTVARLKALVERLAHWKINELQLYVENGFTFRRHPAIGRGYSPFTPEELLAVQDHCRRHHVRLVGSLASFGHFEKILALPAYADLGEMPGFRDLPGGTTLCPGDPRSIRLLEEMYEEFVPLFEADDFNVCCDETWELGRGRSKQRADRVGVGRVYLDFLLKIRRLCARHGKRMNAWADIVLDHPDLIPDVPKDIVMLNWDYGRSGRRIPRTREIAQAGLPCVVCPGTNAWNSHGCRLAMGMGNIAAFAAEGLKRGAEGFLNTDWGDNGHRNMIAVSLHNLAWGAAHAWRHRAVEQRGFTERFCADTFGATAEGLPAAVRTLGRAHEALGHDDANWGILYYTFLTPLRKLAKADEWFTEPLATLSPRGMAAHREALLALKWPRLGRSRDALAGEMMDEFALAARLDALACRRTAAARTLHEGRSVPAAEWRGLVHETERAAAELERVWLLGNKPSRLCDNLAGMRAAVRDYRRMAKR